MSRERRITADDPVWEIVRRKQQENQAVYAASQIPLVQEVMGLFVECDFGDRTVEKDCKKELRRHLVTWYDVPSGRCDEAFNLAEEAIRRGMETNGQA